MKINVLSPEVYNRIAAGEVVDRPYSVVKELVENAIDAGATRIDVAVEGGGKQCIRITDNGGGIAKDDLMLAFLPHATSKLQTADDLFGVQTLGFRGEAVASIAAVSRMTIVSRTAEGEAWSLTSEGGKLGELLPAAGDVGTEVTVRDLFFNTPARQKFLNSDAKEEGDVAAMMARFLLSRPDISFTLTVGGKLRYRSFGDGLAAAVAAVYGAGILDDLYELDAEKNGIRLRGFIGNQNFSKPNRTYQSLFVNGRYVINQTVATAVMSAYRSYLMTRQYPFYVLFLDVSPDVVDVNVHPNKQDVRFADNQVIFGCVYSVISAVLDGNSRALEYLAPREFPKTAERAEAASLASSGTDSPSAVPEKTEAPRMTFEEAKAQLAFEIPKSVGKLGGEQQRPVRLEVRAPDEDVFEENKRALLEAEGKQQRIDPATLQFKGELFHTYLCYECGDDAYLVDQHAAHERILYDKLCEKMASRTVVSQPMLVPYVLHVNSQEFAFLQKRLPVLEEIGFGIEEFGSEAYRVTSVPSDLLGVDLAAFFGEILSRYETFAAIRLSDVLKDKLASAACKAAVKGGEQLTDGEVLALLRRMDGNMGLKCPHGRPVAVHIARSEIEKLFKRIV